MCTLRKYTLFVMVYICRLGPVFEVDIIDLIHRVELGDGRD